jgi:tripartite-type tricarboxylate transporter receptor subunit TctC
MTLPRRHFLRCAVSAAAVLPLARGAQAQSYPTRPVRLILGFPAGGSTDLVARIIGARLSERLGQSFVIENKPGGGTNLAVQTAVNAPPDGYTLLFVTTTNAINTTFYPTLPFNFTRDVAPVAGLADLPFVMEVGPQVPAKTVAEFIAYAKANPGKINMASFGTGTISHLAWELFKSTTGVEMTHVPYHGGAPMVTDLIGGRVQAGIDALPNSLPHIQSGALRALAVTGAARSDAIPGTDRRRDRARLRGEWLDGGRRPRRHAGGDRRHPQPRDQCRADRPAHCGAPRGRGRAADRHDRRAVRRALAARHRQVGEGGEVRCGEAGVRLWKQGEDSRRLNSGGSAHARSSTMAQLSYDEIRLLHELKSRDRRISGHQPHAGLDRLVKEGYVAHSLDPSETLYSITAKGRAALHEAEGND